MPTMKQNTEAVMLNSAVAFLNMMSRTIKKIYSRATELYPTLSRWAITE